MSFLQVGLSLFCIGTLRTPHNLLSRAKAHPTTNTMINPNYLPVQKQLCTSLSVPLPTSLALNRFDISPAEITRPRIVGLERLMIQNIMEANLQTLVDLAKVKAERSSLMNIEATRPTRMLSLNQGLDMIGASILGLSSHEGDKKQSVAIKNFSACPPQLQTKAPAGRIYVDKVRQEDVMCGRGGRSNHHSGNKRYRQVISDLKMMYRKTEDKTTKTDLSRAIVEHVCHYGGRFIRLDKKVGRYYILSMADARKKTSQALRDSKELKWTA